MRDELIIKLQWYTGQNECTHTRALAVSGFLSFWGCFLCSIVLYFDSLTRTEFAGVSLILFADSVKSC